MYPRVLSSVFIHSCRHCLEGKAMDIDRLKNDAHGGTGAFKEDKIHEEVASAKDDTMEDAASAMRAKRCCLAR